jgi:hypothetical protein
MIFSVPTLNVNHVSCEAYPSNTEGNENQHHCPGERGPVGSVGASDIPAVKSLEFPSPDHGRSLASLYFSELSIEQILTSKHRREDVAD